MKKKVFLLALILIFALSLSVQAQIRVGQFPQNVEDEYVLSPENIEVEVWQQNLDVPWELVFLPESNRALITERGGQGCRQESFQMDYHPELYHLE